MSRFGSRTHCSLLNAFQCLFLGCFLVITVGCSEEGPYHKPTIPVTGVVTIDGNIPELHVQIQCHPVGGIDKEYPTVTACVAGEGGKFALSTYDSGDGVPEGEYQLTFIAGEVNLMTGGFSGDIFKGKYSDPKTSEIKISVSDDNDKIDLGTIDLTTK